MPVAEQPLKSEYARWSSHRQPSECESGGRRCTPAPGVRHPRPHGYLGLVDVSPVATDLSGLDETDEGSPGRSGDKQGRTPLIFRVANTDPAGQVRHLDTRAPLAVAVGGLLPHAFGGHIKGQQMSVNGYSISRASWCRNPAVAEGPKASSRMASNLRLYFQTSLGLSVTVMVPGMSDWTIGSTGASKSSTAKLMSARKVTSFCGRT